jgi:integrase
VKHHAALPYSDLPAFMTELRKQEGAAARSLEFTILTAARTEETIGAPPEEINRADKVWTIPGERMKAQKEHRVPLTSQALAILDQVNVENTNRKFIFPGRHPTKGLSNMAMTAVLRRTPY